VQIGPQIRDTRLAPFLKLTLDGAEVLEPERDRREIEHLGIVVRPRAGVVLVLHEKRLSNIPLRPRNVRAQAGRRIKGKVNPVVLDA
jgi:hypothetical protein